MDSVHIVEQLRGGNPIYSLNYFPIVCVYIGLLNIHRHFRRYGRTCRTLWHGLSIFYFFFFFFFNFFFFFVRIFNFLIFFFFFFFFCIINI